MGHMFTKEQSNFIEKNIKGKKVNELTEIFNTHFELNLKATQIRAYTKNHGFKSGLDCKFKKGHATYNKGQKAGIGWELNQFKKGNKPHNYLPVGSEIINAEGYTKVKIADLDTWKFKHILVWEDCNGPVPKGYVVIFGDRNRLNFDNDNLILVSKKQLLILNTNKLIQTDADLTRTGIIIADIHQKIRDRKANGG